MPRVHVLANKMYAEPKRLAGTIAVVVDIVFATTAIAIALERGARDVIPMENPKAARQRAEHLNPGSYLLAGEQDGVPIPGFTAPWPNLLLRENLSGKHLVYSTTNGTVALHLAVHADIVLAMSLLNGQAVADYLSTRHGGRDIVLICAGAGSTFSLEDFYGAGYLVSLLDQSSVDCRVSDAARAAQLLYQGAQGVECVENTYSGRMMAAHGLSEDLRLCQQKSILATVPILKDGRIIPV